MRISIEETGDLCTSETLQKKEKGRERKGENEMPAIVTTRGKWIFRKFFFFFLSSRERKRERLSIGVNHACINTEGSVNEKRFFFSTGKIKIPEP